MQQVIDRARIPLNDSAKDRYSDTDLLGYANEALQRLRSVRADLFIGSLGTAFVNRTIGQTFPVDDVYAAAVADYVTARSESRDSEEELMQRATVFFSLFSAATMGG
jgi:hypothetical protein